MAFIQKDNSGILFKNTRKTESKHPDYNGSATIICGQERARYDLAGWIKKGDRDKFMSLAFKLSKNQPLPVSEKPTVQEQLDEDKNKEDDIPF